MTNYRRERPKATITETAIARTVRFDEPFGLLGFRSMARTTAEIDTAQGMLLVPGRSVSVYCATPYCGRGLHIEPADLALAGYGDIPLKELADQGLFRCLKCGNRKVHSKAGSGGGRGFTAVEIIHHKRPYGNRP